MTFFKGLHQWHLLMLSIAIIIITWLFMDVLAYWIESEQSCPEISPSCWLQDVLQKEFS